MAASVHCIVFSRDRAMQLDAFLKSVSVHAQAYRRVTVLYRTTNSQHARSYDALRRSHATAAWIGESAFRSDLIGLLDGDTHTVFHTDDDVFFRSFRSAAPRKDEVCFSLRLGLNTSYNYAYDAEESAFDGDVEDGRLRWSWRGKSGSFGYPLSLNGHVFRTEDVTRWLDALAFENPNQLESAMQTIPEDCLPATMASFEHSVVTSIPLNVVNEVYFNRAEWSYGADELNERFRLGQRFDLERMDFSNVTSAHAPVTPVLTGGEERAEDLFSAWGRERSFWLRRVRESSDRLLAAEEAKAWLESQCEAWKASATQEARQVKELRTALDSGQRAYRELGKDLQEAREAAAIARRDGDAAAARLDDLLARPAVRWIERTAHAWRRVRMRAGLLPRLLPEVRPGRLVTLGRLAARGDLATIRERARYLAGTNDTTAQGAEVARVPVTRRFDPHPRDLPLLSVVIVCFNYGRYVEEAISSVLAQTAFGLCEIIVVDGGSDDPETITTIGRLAANPPPRTAVHVRSGGRHLVGDNRNFGIARARGRYVVCLDADDLLDPRYVEVALYLLERRGYDVVSTTTLCFGLADGFFDLKLAPDLQDMLQANHLTTVAAFRRELWERAGGFHDVGLGDAYVFEDWKLWQRFAALGARMTNIRKPLFGYRMHSRESLSRQSGDVRALAAHRAAVASFNADVITPKALAESRRRRDMEITVEGSFENLRADGVERPTLWLALPFTLTGGAERLLSAVTRHLVDAGLRVILTTTVPVDPGYGDSTPWFEEATKEIYHLPDLLRPEYWSDFLDYLVDVKKIDVLLVAGSDAAYRRLPHLRDRFPQLRVVDLLFNTEGHVDNNRRYRDVIDLHLCESHAVRDWLLESGEDSDSVIVIESGIDVSRYRPRKRRREFPLRVGFSGRLSEEKAPLKFVELAGLVPDPRFHFVMTGAGPLSEEVRLRAEGLGADRFSFLGVVEDIRAHVASLDILVLPSIVDGRPMVVLEALASGVPVVASRVGGLPDLVRDGETGFLVDPGDLAAIAGHLRRLADDPDELERIRLSARAFAEAHLSAETMLRAYECILSGLATSRGRRMERERG